ncbi:hypothetical protein [Chamaesiphon sp.]|uniref:hypothetical protein n=1 Tax=Chamaesiphon sp. TaxID=2814140 RepID=UPI003594570C
MPVTTDANQFIGNYQVLAGGVPVTYPGLDIDVAQAYITPFVGGNHAQYLTNLGQLQGRIVAPTVYTDINSSYAYSLRKSGYTDLYMIPTEIVYLLVYVGSGVTFQFQGGQANEGSWLSLNVPYQIDPAWGDYYEQAFVVRADVYGSPGNRIIDAPCYRDLVSGYSLDNRIIPENPIVIPSVSKEITLSYYRQNKLESIPDLKSICWMSYKCSLIKNIPYTLPINDCVLGTLYSDDPQTLADLVQIPPVAGAYDWIDLLPQSITSLFDYWMTLYDARNTTLPALSLVPVSRQLHKIAANNDVWNNANLASNVDVNPDPLHPMFIVDDVRAYDWHIAPQTEGIGTLIMDSPRTIEIHTALNASQYLLETPENIGTGTAQNPETPAQHKLDWYILNNPKLVSVWKALGRDTFVNNRIKKNDNRITNIGWYVENIARVLGLRFDDDGRIDSQLEESKYLRQIFDNLQYDRQAYSKNSFGKFGRLTPHLSNSNGRDSWDKVADIPQMIEACFEHVNRSVGIQQGTEIRVRNPTTDKIDYYPNQLAMLLDIHAKITEMQLNSKQSFNLLYVMSHELRELWSGVGIPMVYKTLWNRYGEIRSIGHQSDKGSILTHLTTLKINVGILVGNLIARPKDPRNPLERIFSKKKNEK